MKKIKQNELGFGAVEVILVIVIVVLIGAVGWMVFKNHIKTTTPLQSKTTNCSTEPELTAECAAKNSPVQAQDPYAGWETYTSSTEKASFKYPSTWKSVTPPLASNEPGADVFTVASPSNAIDVSWMSAITGLGGYCDGTITPKDGGCPVITVLSSDAIKGASGLKVVSAIITYDGTSYQPWIGVNTADFGSGAKSPYITFFGRNNSSLTNTSGQKQLMFFGTSGPGMKGPSLTKVEATTWFNKSEIQQAKLIFASLSY